MARTIKGITLTLSDNESHMFPDSVEIGNYVRGAVHKFKVESKDVTSNTITFKAGSNVSLKEENGTITISSTDTDTNTHRDIKVNGNSIGTGALNLQSGTNISVTKDTNGNVTIANSYSYSLPSASQNTKGGAKIWLDGTTLYISTT